MKGVLALAEFQQYGELVVSPHFPPPLAIVEPHVVIDSREVTAGGIFIALQGERTDGHCYVNAVFEHGAAWAMVSRAWFTAQASPIPPDGKGFIVVDDTVVGLQQLARLYRSTFSIPVVAIGGSNGKTTTKEMVAVLLRSRFVVAVSQGNKNNHLGVPLTLLQFKRDTEIAVVEVGINHPHEMAFLVELVQPTHGLLTNIGHEHLEFLIDLDGVAAEETALYRYLQVSGGTAFVNDDDARLRKAAQTLPVVISYGVSQENNHTFWASNVAFTAEGKLHFMLCSNAEQIPIELHLIGRHNVLNAIAAATVGVHFGCSLQQIQQAFKHFVPASGWKRLEVLDASGVTIINDTYNANSDSMRLALDALCDMPCAGKRIAILGDMLELGAAAVVEHQAIAHYIQHSSVQMLLTFGEYAHLICKEASTHCKGHYTSHEELLEKLLSVLQEGDVVLCKGSRGMKLERIAEGVIKASKARTKIR